MILESAVFESLVFVSVILESVVFFDSGPGLKDKQSITACSRGICAKDFLTILPQNG